MNDAVVKKLGNIILSTKQVTLQHHVFLYPYFTVREDTRKKGRVSMDNLLNWSTEKFPSLANDTHN